MYVCYMCICCMDMCEVRGQYQVVKCFPQLLHLVFWGRVSLNLESPVHLDGLASKPQSSTCFFFISAEITGKWHYSGLFNFFIFIFIIFFRWVLGLISQVLYLVSHLSSPMCLFLNTVQFLRGTGK